METKQEVIEAIKNSSKKDNYRIQKNSLILLYHNDRRIIYRKKK